MASFIGELRRAFASPVPYVAWLTVSAILALTGPFGTYGALDLPDRAVFWSVIAGASVFWGTALRVFLMNRFAGLGYGRAVAIASAVSACVLAVPIYSMILLRSGGGDYRLRPAIELGLTILVSGLAIGGLRRIAPAGGLRLRPPGGPRLLERIEPGLRGALIRMAARDHYLEVVTDAGKVDLLMRFSDALAELDGIDGLQVHRSHWVAAQAVSGTERAGDKLLLVTVDGARVPVSRKHRPQVMARGLID